MSTLLDAPRTDGKPGFFGGRQHQFYLSIYMFVVLAHWAEHVVQAIQLFVLGAPRPEALGLLGVPAPVLVQSEGLHYGYAVVMLVAFWLLRGGFVGRSRRWWDVALLLQAWHFVEHQILFVQSQLGTAWFGAAERTSILQLVIPRIELHLLYNLIVTLPMIVAVGYHLVPTAEERAEMRCTCALHH